MASKTTIKFNFNRSFDVNLDFNYIDFPMSMWRAIRLIYKSGIFFGLGLHTYYSNEISWKQKLLNKNYYTSKLQIKKDSRYFYGLVLSRKLNFLSTTVTLRNVFYNEIMEKKYPIFSARNTLVSQLESGTVKHFLSTFLKNKKNKKTFYHIRNYPRALSRIVLTE